MARVRLDIRDLPNRLAVKAMLEAEAHDVFTGAGDAQVVITDQPEAAEHYARGLPVLLLSPVQQIPRAIHAMRKGAFGYVLLPLQPGEVGLMVERAIVFAHGTLGRRPLHHAPDEQIIHLTLEELEEAHILETMRRCRNNQARAARELGIGRNTLWRKLKKIEGKMPRLGGT
jgi:DNA-binding NtrC family response regulator